MGCASFYFCQHNYIRPNSRSQFWSWTLFNFASSSSKHLTSVKLHRRIWWSLNNPITESNKYLQLAKPVSAWQKNWLNIKKIYIKILPLEFGWYILFCIRRSYRTMFAKWEEPLYKYVRLIRQLYLNLIYKQMKTESFARCLRLNFWQKSKKKKTDLRMLPINHFI